MTDATNASQATTEVSRFLAVQTQRYMYNVDKCKDKPLVGWLLALIQMPPIDNRVWHAFLIRTTEDTLGIEGRGENADSETPVPVPAGSDVLIPATHELAAYLMKPAFNPTAVYEVKIVPKVKIKVGRTRQMWTYGIEANPKPLPRREFGITALLSEKPTALTFLTTGEPVPAGGDDEIPF